MLLAFLLVSGVGGFLMAGMAVPFVTAAGTVANSTTGLFNELPTELDIDKPSEQSIMLAADGSVLATFYADNRIIVGYEDIAPAMRDAIVAIEDRRFYEHNGVDPEGMARAFLNNTLNNSTEGASTLTQQYVKNIFIERGRVTGDQEIVEEATEQTYGRKLQEARYAIALEEKYSKDEILTGYLNIAQFGASVYGVEAAARAYFSKSASELTISESALLAGVPQAPGKWDPLRNPENAIVRRDQVLSDMLELGFITRAEYNEATALTIEEMLKPQTISSGCGSAGTAAYFCEYVVKELLNDESFGETVDERRALLLRGGLVVETTLDPKHQKAAYDAVASTVPVNDSSNVKQAIVSVVPGTGEIRAIAQNTNYGTNAVPEDPSRTAVNFAVDRAHGGGEGFQTGSAFKALVLTQWLRTGHSLSDIVAGNKPSYPRDVWNISCAPENRPLEPYEPKNLEGSGGERVSVLEATRKSINLPFVEMASQMDLCGIADVAGSMGLKKGNGEPLEIVPSMALGSNTITPLDMASAFATFANDGVYCSPVAISRVTTREGEELAVPESECTRVLETEIARGMNYALQEVAKPGGTGSAAALPGRPIAGKTGTANMDYHAWFVGYTPQLAAAVWTGHNEGNVSMFDSVINGRYYRYVYGGVIAAPAWKKYMEVAMEGAPVEGFPSPNEKTIYGEKRAVPNVYGRSIASATEILEEAGFAVDVGGRIYSSYAYDTVAGMTPRAGAQLTAGSVIVLNPSAGPAPAPPTRPEPEPEPEPGPPEDDDDGGRGGGNERVP
jgi:membrane peptidoglycan carboxypeptidase